MAFALFMNARNKMSSKLMKLRTLVALYLASWSKLHISEQSEQLKGGCHVSCEDNWMHGFAETWYTL